jgi:hypothetical protein
MGAPSTDWKETPAEGEAEHLEQLAQQVLELQKKHADGAKGRALHAKAHSGLEAEFTVLPELPEHARIGLFAKPGSLRAYARFSNGSAARRSDKEPDVRGFAIKVVGVAGKKLIPGMEDAQTQDFLMIRSAALAFKDADEFVRFLAITEPAALLPVRALAAFGLLKGPRILARVLKGVSSRPASLATEAFYSAAAIRFGPYAVHYAVEPKEKGGGAPADDLGAELAARLAKGPVDYDFKVQFFVDENKTPIEDPSVEWKTEDAPFVTLARLRLLQQDVASDRGRKIAQAVEGFSFDPWHALLEHRPLGNIMRARAAAYRMSVLERNAQPEPDGSERF